MFTFLFGKRWRKKSLSDKMSDFLILLDILIFIAGAVFGILFFFAE